MTEQTADASVVIPTRNRARYILGAIETAVAQDGVDVEVIVVDDASTDETPRILAGVQDPRVRVVTHSTRQGVAAARNSGIAAASSEWIAFLDDDDLWAPHKTAAQLAAADRVGADFAYGGAVAVDEWLSPLYLWRLPESDVLLKELLVLNVMPAGASNVIARADLLGSVGPLDVALSHSSDWDLWIRLAAAGRGVCVRHVLTAYRLHVHGQHGDLGDEVLEEVDVIGEKHRALAERLGVEVDRAAMASYVAKRALQVQARRAENGAPPNGVRAGLALSRRVVRRALRLVAGRKGSAPPESPDWLSRKARELAQS